MRILLIAANKKNYFKFVGIITNVTTSTSVSANIINGTDEIFFISTKSAGTTSRENVSFVISTTKYLISGNEEFLNQNCLELYNCYDYIFIILLLLAMCVFYVIVSKYTFY